MTAITESPVFVLFNPAVRSAVSKDLPITLYESGALRRCCTFQCCLRLTPRRCPSVTELHVVNDAPVLTFVKSAYTIEARVMRVHHPVCRPATLC
jgi:hypothetical protein